MSLDLGSVMSGLWGWPWVSTTADTNEAVTADMWAIPFNLQRHLDEYGIKWFKAFELAGPVVPPRDLWSNVTPTARLADELRRRFGRTYCNSEALGLDGRGYRTALHNEEVGGRRDSLHMRFNALDLTCETGSPQEWADFLRTEYSLDRIGGIGVYSTFIHIDTRWLVFGRPPAHWVG